ncbi:MAG: hypothetical protein ACRD1N_02825, partial [Terriglobia bacterium]
MDRQLRLVELCILLTLIAVTAACHKRVPGVTGIPAAPSSGPAPAPPGPPTCTLTAEPATITAGQSVTLTWTSSNASTLELKPGLGQQEA